MWGLRSQGYQCTGEWVGHVPHLNLGIAGTHPNRLGILFADLTCTPSTSEQADCADPLAGVLLLLLYLLHHHGNN